MSEPLQVQLFNAFLGTEEGIHSIILSDIFSPGGSINLYIDKYGRAKKILGYAKANSSAITTDTGGSATKVSGLFNYHKNSGGSTTRQAIGVFDDGVNEWEIWKSTNSGSSWTFLSDLGSTPVGVLPDFAQFGDDLFITSGKVAPKRYDGTSVSAAGTTQSPTPTASSTGTGVLNGIYRYKLVARLDDDTRKAGSVSSGQISVSNTKADLSWTADADTHVVGYEVYRTLGTGSIFYFLTFVDGRTTVAYTDNSSDAVLLANRALDEHGDAPPTVYYVEPHKQRMWWGKTDTYPTRAYWSDPGDADSVYAYNYLDFSDSDTQGDVMTGMLGNVGNALIVFTERAVWTVSGTGGIIGDIVDWNRDRSNAQTGCVSVRSACRVPAGARYMSQTGEVNSTTDVGVAYFSPLGDIRLFDGENDMVISHPVKDTVLGFSYAGRATTHVLHDPSNSHFIWFFPTGSSVTPDTAVVWNYRWGVWYVWDTQPFLSSVEIDSSSDASILLTGAATTGVGGFTYTFFSGNDFAGSSIAAHWMTKALRGLVGQDSSPALAYTKRWRWADFLFQADNGIELTVEWVDGSASDLARGVGQARITPTTTTIVSANSSILNTANASSITVSLASNQRKILLHASDGRYLHEPGIRLRIGDNATTGQWALEGFSLGYQVLPGHNRRLQ